MNLPVPLARIAAFAELSEADVADLMPLAGATREFRRGERLFNEGDTTQSPYLLLEGWAASSMSVADGTRQMLRVHLPGDMIGLPSLSVTRAPDTITALTRVRVSRIPLPAIGELFERSPRLAALLFLVSQDERVMLMDRLMALGRMSGPGRFAAILLQLHQQILRRDPDVGETIEVPLTQEDFAELAGTSHVHLSRMMAKLRRDGVIAYDRRSVTILNKDELMKLAGLPKRELASEPDWIPSK